MYAIDIIGSNVTINGNLSSGELPYMDMVNMIEIALLLIHHASMRSFHNS